MTSILVGYDASGMMTCPSCWGRRHRIGAATTTAAECQTCRGKGYVTWQTTVAACQPATSKRPVPPCTGMKEGLPE